MRRNSLFTRLIKFVSCLKDKYFDSNLDLRVQVFNLLCFAGIAAGVIVALICVLQNAGALAVLFNLLPSAFAVVLLRLAGKKLSLRLCCWVSVIFVFMISFPVQFFQTGGYRGGTPGFFIFAFIFTAILFTGRERAAALAVEFVLYIDCCLAAYFYPGTVRYFETEAYYVSDIIAGIVIPGALVFGVILLYVRIYDNRQKQLEELDKMKTEFMQSISHELKIPLSNIRNYALDTLKELERGELNIPAMEYDQKIIRAEGQRLIFMVNQLLDVTAIEGGRIPIRKERVSLAALLLRVAETNGRLFTENGNRAALEIADGLPDITAAPDIIERVTVNLIGNAARHTRNGVITVSLSAGDGFQQVCVADTGEGIHPDVQSQVFLRYIERENTMSGHSGLGLFICKRLMDAHGGEIGIESDREKGAAVWFRLPADR